jgi:hypothetical protein
LDDVDCVHVAEDLVQWRLLVYLFMYLWFDKTVNNSDYITLNDVIISE